MVNRKLKQYLKQDIYFHKILKTKIFAICMTLWNDPQLDYIYKYNNTFWDILDPYDDWQCFQCLHFNDIAPLSLSRSDKKCWQNFHKTFLAYSQNWYFISNLFSQQVKKKNVSQANTLVGKNKTDWSSFPGWFTAVPWEVTVRGALLGPLFRSSVWMFLSVQASFWNPGVDLIYLHTGISRVLFLGFEFRKCVFFWVLVRAVVFFGGCQTNAVF